MEISDEVKALLNGATDEEILELLKNRAKGEMGDHPPQSYQSCIKIRGRPILPPIMTDKLRLECQEWRMKAIEVENNIKKRKEATNAKSVADLTSNLIEKHKLSDTTTEVEESNKEDVTHKVLLSEEESELGAMSGRYSDSNIPGYKSEEGSGSPVTSDNNYDSMISGPRSFEEIKHFVKQSENPQMKSLNPMELTLSNPTNGIDYVSSDISDDDTEAPSLKTEEIIGDGMFKVSPFKSVISRCKKNEIKDYNLNIYLDKSRSGPYDSLQSVNTVIENPSFQKQKVQNILTATQQSERYESDFTSVESTPRSIDDLGGNESDNPIDNQRIRSRRGSYSLSKPSPILLAHMKKFGDQEDMSLRTKSPAPVDTNIKSDVSNLDNQLNNQEKSTEDVKSRPPAHVPDFNPGKENVGNLIVPRLNLGLETNRSLSPDVDQTVTYRISPSNCSSLLSKDMEKKGELSNVIPSKAPEQLSLGVSKPSLSDLSFNDISIKDQDDLQSVVSNLAISQQNTLKELLLKQEQEREQLRKSFELQQKSVINKIVSQFPKLSFQNTPQKSEIDMDSVIKNGSVGSAFIDQDGSDETASTSDDLENLKTLTPPMPRRVIKSNAIGRSEVRIPPEAYSPDLGRAWTLLTAIGRGFLVRRLLRTERVGRVKSLMLESLSCALSLHREARDSSAQTQDLSLHSRLLAQLEAACREIHHIFFNLSTKEKLAIIAQDRAAKKTRLSRGEEKRSPALISSATRARLQAKEAKKLAPQQENKWSRKRANFARDAKLIKSMPALRGYSNLPSNNITTRMTRSVPSSTRVASSATGSSPVKIHSRPVWK